MDPENEREVSTVDADEHDFWQDLEDVLSKECDNYEDIDDALRAYLETLQSGHERGDVATENDLGQCAYILYASKLFDKNAKYVRQQLIYSLLEEDDANFQRIVVTFLLADARENESTFGLMNKQGAFPRLVELIGKPQQDEQSLHRSLMELLYELARIQKVTNDDLSCINDEFIAALFDIIEQVSDDVNDPYHYPVIRVLLVLNEQFMVAAHDPVILAKKSMPLTNKVVKVLSAYGHRYKTFGANIILLLNREDETSLQLLTLKLLYLLFTTPLTYEYFYTNDLHVLVDILIRNLLDLPDHATALRHTYLRVLYPLLEHTQLNSPPFYKRNDIRKLLAILCGDRVENEDGTLAENVWNHFDDTDDTTKRLVRRCQTVSWLGHSSQQTPHQTESPVDENVPDPESPHSPSKPKPPQLPAPRKLKKRTVSKGSGSSAIASFLTPQLEAARQSSISMVEMAQQKEKPGVITPSRNPSMRQSLFSKKEKPAPPQARRSNQRRPKNPHMATELEVTREALTDEPASMNDEVQESGPYHDLDGPPYGYQIVPLHVQEPHIMPQSEAPEDHSTKKPPPAPKARRGWRLRRSRDANDGTDRDLPKQSVRTDAGEITNALPHVHISQSPFSPVHEKTLDPLSPSGSPSEVVGTTKRSVSDALHQAQTQAEQQVEDCLEKTHVSEQPTANRIALPPPTSSLHSTSSARRIESESPSSIRAVLAPPSQTPTRGVPGPKVNLERSPFISDDENESPTPREEKASPGLKTKESWEDFDNDD